MLEPGSKKFKAISSKVKKWAAGKADADYEFFYRPAKERLARFADDGQLEGASEIMKFVTLHSDIGVCSWWNFHKFLDLHLNKGDSENKWKLLLEAMQLRVLENALGYTKPQNTAPANDGRIAMAICDAIILQDPLGANIINGYRQQEERRPMLNPQSAIQYAFALYCHQQKETIDYSKLFKKPLVSAYADLLENIDAGDAQFTQALESACEFHLERSKSSLDYEFSREEDMIIPSELLATIMVRKATGGQISEVPHPLIKPFLEFLKLQRDLGTSDWYKRVRERIEKEFF